MGNVKAPQAVAVRNLRAGAEPCPLRFGLFGAGRFIASRRVDRCRGLGPTGVGGTKKRFWLFFYGSIYK